MKRTGGGEGGCYLRKPPPTFKTMRATPYFPKAKHGVEPNRIVCRIPQCDETARQWANLDGKDIFVCPAHCGRIKKHNDPHRRFQKCS